MDRRQLLKGLAALPLARLNYASAAPSICSGTCQPVNGSLLVWLEGPFAVVINRDNAGQAVDITAFSPMDADHLTKIESLKGAYPEQFHLALQTDGIVPATTVCISSDFSSFCIEQLGKIIGNPDGTFVRLKLPLPKNIYTSELLKGKLAGNNVCIPQDHVFEYDTVPGKPITLYYEDAKQQLHPNNPANKLFHIEVGLDSATSSAEAIAHAKRFHKTILAHFGLQNDPRKQITDFSTTRCRGTIPREIADRLPVLQIDTTTLECKSGGIIGGSP